MSTVLITGATSGFGKAMAYKFASEGYDLIITGRRADRLETIKKDIRSQHDVHVLSLHFDVRDQEAVKTAIRSIPNESRKEIKILINNAGLAVGRDTIDNGNTDDWDRMIDTNVKGLLYVSKEVIPILKENGEGHIINIASTAGKETYLSGNVYCASKHAVDSLSKAMRIDLLPYGIKVTNIAPGLAETEFSVVRFKGDQEKADAVYQGFAPLTGEDVAEVAFYAASTPKHVCLNDIVITCTSQANSFYLHK
ncbi:MAG: SDR family NAD(P)-dependent oxidoreductase [Crocinitomicaceae bacterium]|nr:SDR family NAD(P)-dependent oxidoreductase [Crocinitomicaceae bacterium]